jgi:hypothetical protein
MANGIGIEERARIAKTSDSKIAAFPARALTSLLDAIVGQSRNRKKASVPVSRIPQEVPSFPQLTQNQSYFPREVVVQETGRC